MAEGKKSIKRQGVAYLVVGAISALIELVVFQLLYAVAGLSIPVANTIALATSTVFNFIANRNVTFQSTSSPVRSIVCFAVLWVANATITSIAISLMVGAGMSSIIAKLIMQVCVAVWDFFLYRKVIFI